ncbi:MAG: pyrroline-5-carboxylate reductase [Planctomycetota bacterium]
MGDQNNIEIPGDVVFLGAGRMATALAEGFVSSAGLAPGRVHASDPNAAARQKFIERVPGATAGAANAEVLPKAGIAFLAVKPQVIDELLRDVGKSIPADALVVSLAAGVTLSRLASRLPKRARLVRVMPNTPCLVGRGASAFSLGEHATPGDAELVAGLLSAVGYAVCVEEKHLDAVTGLSGSGPAFVYTVVEALADAGVRAGLPRDIALKLAAETVAGAAEMVATTGEHPAALRDAVTSPAGTTAAGLAELERHGLPWALQAAVAAATQRSRELAEG